MSDTFDLDEFVAEFDVSPRKVKLAGATYTIRRDLTGPELVQYWEYVNTSDDGLALSILVGEEDGPKLNAALIAMPQKRMVAAANKLMTLSGIAEEKNAGE